MANHRVCLDKLLFSRGLVSSLEEARDLIVGHKIKVEGVFVDNPNCAVLTMASVVIERGGDFVGRGAHKLEGFFCRSNLDVAGKVCGDFGASTGGFTQVLLKRGAAKVYAVDVAYGEIDWQLRTDTRVHLMERTNVRLLEKMPESLDFACLDLSFISLKLVLLKVVTFLKEGAQVAALFKPQFEAKYNDVPVGGVIEDRVLHRQLLEQMWSWLEDNNLGPRAIFRSVLPGSSGNREFFLWLQPGNQDKVACQKMIVEETAG